MKLSHTTSKDTISCHALLRLVGAIMGTPADVVKARIMNQATDQYGRGLVYKSSVDCAMQTIKGEGFLGELYSIISISQFL